MMKRLYWDDKKSILLIQSALSQDEIIAGTSDTVVGLLANITNRSFQGVNAVKKRKNKPYLVLIGSIEKAQLFVDENRLFQIEKITNRYWPGPLTIILPARPGIPDFMTSPEGNIALRVPNHQGLLAVLQKFDGLFSTSANIADQPVPPTVDQINPEVLQKVAYLVVNREEKKSTVASTILDCTGKGIRIIREGEISRQELEKIYGMLF